MTLRRGLVRPTACLALVLLLGCVAAVAGDVETEKTPAATIEIARILPPQVILNTQVPPEYPPAAKAA